MAEGAVNFNLDAQDDPVLPDQVPSFEGGQFSNLRANLLQQNQSKLLGNCDIDRLGKIRTRRGTILLGDTPPDSSLTPSTAIIQGLTSYQSPAEEFNYVVAAHNKKIWKFNGTTWDQIATGGTADNEDILICREGVADASGTLAMGVTEIVVDAASIPAVAAPIYAPGEKLYFVNNRRTDPFEYVIKSWDAGTRTITLEEPGLVFEVHDNWKFIVTRPAKVNGVFAAGALSIAIDGYSGAPAVGEKFVIKSENITHTLGVGSTNVLLNFTPGLITDYTATTLTDPVEFAEGNDVLFISDGAKPIAAWNGKTLMTLNSHSILDDLQSTAFSRAQTAAPTGCKIIIWFQNRLIASGIAAEPDAIYFSDFFDPTSWDHYYQKVRIGGGESDPITGLLAWTDYNLLVFKKNAIYVINLDPSQNPDQADPTLLAASYSVKQLHKLIGCPAPHTAVQVGGGSTTPGSDVFFVDGDKKVHSIRRVMAAETQQEVGTAVSLPIQDVLDTIDIDGIDRAVAMYHNEHYILGLPSTRGDGDTTLPNATVAYNLLTQSWCGVWGWGPTCFSRRTDLGSYSKLIFGDTQGRVVQWMDDISLDEETATSYVDRVDSLGNGQFIHTQILTRAFTGGDAYSYKTGFNVEFEFDESVADNLLIQVVLDKVVQTPPLADPFNTLSEPRLRVPFTLHTVAPHLRLPESPGLLRKSFDLQRYGTWRELQFFINTNRDPDHTLGGKLAIRSIRVTFFMDTLKLQTVPTTESAVFETPPILPSFP